MKLLVALLFATTLLGCTHPDSPFAVWQEIPSGDRISLTPEFTRSLRATVASSGSLKPRTDPPLSMAPEGIIEIDDSSAVCLELVLHGSAVSIPLGTFNRRQFGHR